MKKSLFHFHSALVLGSIILFASCSKDDDNTIAPYTVPATYTFENVDYKEATARIKMLSAINTYAGTTQANANKVALDATKANNLWNNTNSPFDTAWLNTSGVSIAEKTSDAATYKGFLDKLVVLSNKDLAPASSGTEGYITRGTRKIMVSSTGFEYVQGIQKGVMGATFFKEAMSLLDKTLTSNNTNSTPGKGTEMAHNFDLAFGYLTLPVNFDTSIAFFNANKANLVFWGNYQRERGLYIQSGDKLWKAFRTGRAAIVANDTKVLTEQIAIIREYWEKTAAAAAYAYVTTPLTLTDLGEKLHNLSEGYGFVLALKFRAAGSKLTDANYQALLAIMNTNFYDLTAEPNFTKLKQAQTILVTAYGQLQAN